MDEVINMEEVRVAEVPTVRADGEIMDAFTSRFRCAQPVGGGVRLHALGGWVTVIPRQGSVMVQAEGASAEVAEELCGFFQAEVKGLDAEK